MTLIKTKHNKTKHNKTKHTYTIKKKCNTSLSTLTNNNLLLNNKSIDTITDTKNYITSEVVDDTTYDHFKSLINNSPNLCKGKTQAGKHYKIRKSILKDMNALYKDKHYKIIYVHNNKEIIAYISTQLYSKDGGFMFIHKLCSEAGTGQGSRLFNMILEDGKTNYEKLGITYLSLTTQNLDIIGYYKQFNPTRTVIIDTPESKAKVPEKCAYMIWQLSPDMPFLNYV
jgi:hypothetical protein